MKWIIPGLVGFVATAVAVSDRSFTVQVAVCSLIREFRGGAAPEQGCGASMAVLLVNGRVTLTRGLEPPTLRGMDTLHAPWRIQYILAPKAPPSDVSLFARVGQSNDDIANHVVVRDRTCFAMLNAYPYTGGHLLIAPYKQVENFNGLMDEELLDLMKLTRRAQNVLTRVMKPDGFNVGVNLGRVAGAGIAEHLHIHIVPRWNGDTNFMPVLAGATVVPEALTDLAAKLRAAFIEG